MQKRGAALRAVQDGASAVGQPSVEAGSGRTRVAERPPLPEFTPVPRKYRHDGWTPERQKAFIEALADCGSVTRAAAQVNMAQANCYALRRPPGAEEFRRAWDAALDFGLKRLKDVAFERAIEGQLVPVFVAGKLIGFRRKHNDALLMFCLRHYGQDQAGKRTTINYFSSRASAGGPSTLRPSSGQASLGTSGVSAAGADALLGTSGVSAAGAEASATTVRTVITGPAGAGQGSSERDDRAAALMEGFEGVELDARASAEIAAALEACAARARAADAAYEQGGAAAADAAEEDPGQTFFRSDDPYRGELVPPVRLEEYPFAEGEENWRMAGAEIPAELLALRNEAGGE